ncbi:MAG: dockerin type I repeat-containing protein, partial [Candidatus Pacebacteria bacterium]|nr:dockerin type I repeat-containing protein [Candidatus Paceibacterota bacterium]
GGGAGGGGGGVTVLTGNKFATADLNGDGKVNSVDFSILLYYWKSKVALKNPLVDINRDGKVNSVDFSIMLYQWSKKTTPLMVKR